MNRLSTLRKEKNISIRKLASETNISAAVISMIENEKRTMTLKHALAFSNFFNVPISYMIGMDVSKYVNEEEKITMILNEIKEYTKMDISKYDITDKDKLILKLMKKISNENISINELRIIENLIDSMINNK